MIDTDTANLTKIIRQLHIKTQYLKKIRQIENEILQNTGYAFKNMNDAQIRFEKNYVDKNTKELILTSMAVRRELGRKMNKELRQLLDIYLNKLNMEYIEIEEEK